MLLEEKMKINEESYCPPISDKTKKSVFTKRIAYGLIAGLVFMGDIYRCELVDEPDSGCGGNETTCGPGCMPKGAKCCNSNGTGDYCSVGNCGVCNDGYGNYYNCCV